MPYQKSAARNDFESTLKTISAQIKFSSTKKNKIPHEIQQCVYRNAIFQSSAAIEEYIKSIFEDWIHLLHRNSKNTNDIPSELVYWAAGKKQKSAFQHYIAFGDESKFIETLSKTPGLPDFFSRSTLVKNIITQAEHVRDRKYPSKKNILALFKRFGINDLFKTIQIKEKKDYKKILESFSDVRTAIAHEHPTPDITHVDTIKQITSIKDLVAIIDRIMYSHVIKISGADCWKTQRI